MPELQKLIEQAKALVATMTPEEREARAARTLAGEETNEDLARPGRGTLPPPPKASPRYRPVFRSTPYEPGEYPPVPVPGEAPSEAPSETGEDAESIEEAGRLPVRLPGRRPRSIDDIERAATQISPEQKRAIYQDLADHFEQRRQAREDAEAWFQPVPSPEESERDDHNSAHAMLRKKHGLTRREATRHLNNFYGLTRSRPKGKAPEVPEGHVWRSHPGDPIESPSVEVLPEGRVWPPTRRLSRRELARRRYAAYRAPGGGMLAGVTLDNGDGRPLVIGNAYAGGQFAPDPKRLDPKKLSAARKKWRAARPMN
jgi:hypothetical protein